MEKPQNDGQREVPEGVSRLVIDWTHATGLFSLWCNENNFVAQIGMLEFALLEVKRMYGQTLAASRSRITPATAFPPGRA